MKRSMVSALAALAALASVAADMASQKWVEMKLRQLRGDIMADFAASGGVTQAWVEGYVSNAVNSTVSELAATAVETYTNGVTTITVGKGTANELSVSIEDASVYALMATNALPAASAYGVTNGAFFVWNGDGTYIGGNGEIIAATNYCFQWRTHNSRRMGGLDVFSNYFGVVGAKLQPSVAASVTNALAAASGSAWRNRARRLLAFVGAFFVGSAWAATTDLTPQNWPEPGGWLPYNWISTASMAAVRSGGEYIAVEYVDGIIKWPSGLGASDIAKEALQQALDAKVTIRDVVQKLEDVTFNFEIEDPETGEKAQTSPAPSSDPERPAMYVSNIINRDSADVKVDGLSVVTNSSGVISLKNYPNAAISNGMIPWYQYAGLAWFSLGTLFDGKSVEARAKNGAENQVDAGGISLAGWDSPTTGDHSCSPTLAAMLQDAGQGGGDDRTHHYVLTRYANGGDPILHYTAIGNLNAGTALKFIGTDGNAKTVGSGAVTNTVTFASASDSDVKVAVSGSDGAITVTIGVYYR